MPKKKQKGTDKKPKVAVEPDVSKMPVTVGMMNELISKLDQRFKLLDEALGTHREAINVISNSVQNLASRTTKTPTASDPISLILQSLKPADITKLLKELFSGEEKPKDNEFTKMAKDSYKRRMKVLEDRELVLLDRERLRNIALKLDLGLEEE